jgi:AraC-like DNA-binding protein
MRYEMWREEFGRKWLAADFSPIGCDYLASEITASRHSFITLGSMRGTPLQIHHRDGVTENALGNMCFIVASGCCMRASQCGRSIELSRGDITLLTAAEPALLTQLTEGERWSIRIPHGLLADLCKDVEDKMVRQIACGELSRLLSHQIEAARRLRPKHAPSADHATAQYMLDLVVLCLGADESAARVARHRGLAVARLGLIKAEILRNLPRSDLGLTKIAASQGVSARYVQHLFERSGESFTGFVLEQRLLSAHRLLREPLHRARKISDVANAAGFSDVSYFNRAFRRRFGATPKDVRTRYDRDAPMGTNIRCSNGTGA